MGLPNSMTLCPPLMVTYRIWGEQVEQGQIGPTSGEQNLWAKCNWTSIYISSCWAHIGDRVGFMMVHSSPSMMPLLAKMWEVLWWSNCTCQTFLLSGWFYGHLYLKLIFVFFQEFVHYKYKSHLFTAHYVVIWTVQVQPTEYLNKRVAKVRLTLQRKIMSSNHFLQKWN